MHRGHGVASTHDGGRTGVSGNSFGDSNGAGIEGWSFEDTHWAVPDNCLGVGDFACVQLYGLGADIKPHLIGWDGLRSSQRGSPHAGLDFWSNHIVYRQEEFDLP